VSFEKYNRKKIMHYLGDLFQSRLKFPLVNYKMPASASPPGTELPAIYIFRGNDPQQHLTNLEKRSEMMVHLVGFLENPSGDLEADKADLQDECEELIYLDITFGGLLVKAEVKRADATSFALIPLGIQSPVLPPHGAFRMDVECMFDYLIS
jgi:hypothetical protein